MFPNHSLLQYGGENMKFKIIKVKKKVKLGIKLDSYANFKAIFETKQNIFITKTKYNK